jgi:hypothetical protein
MQVVWKMDRTQSRIWSLKRGRPAPALLITVGLLLVGFATATAIQPDGLMLVKITLQSPADLLKVEMADLPIYARLTHRGESYLLAGATRAEVEALHSRDLDVAVLDPDMRGADYYLVSGQQPRRLQLVQGQIELLHSDGTQAIVRGTQTEAEKLAADGFEIAALSLDPIHPHPRSAGAIPESIQADPFVAAMIAQVDTSRVYQYEAWLTGEEAVEIGGQPYTIATRHTYSGTPIQRATQLAYEHLESLGLEVEYQQWGEVTHPNVIATLPGSSRPDDIYLISAHLDDMPGGALAPGADDNASGSAGVLVAADILSQYQFACTLKFALWTGEEQGMLGSDAWAEWASRQDLNILGVLNMDMIAHDSDRSPIVDLHARSWLSDSVAMANVFADVVGTYELDLVPDVQVDNALGNYSDNRSFWDEGYPAILVIEDRDDFTPYYHTASDTLSTLNMPYFSEFVKGSVGTFVHMSDCLVREGAGTLSGRVFAAAGSQNDPDPVPIAGAVVSIQDTAGHIFPTVTDDTGYYSHILPAGVYTMTTSAHGYLPATVSSVVVFAAATGRQDFYLDPIPVAVIKPLSLQATVFPESQVTQTLGLTNTGRADLEFSLRGLDGTGEGMVSDTPWLLVRPTAGNLAPGQGVSLTVTFNPAGLQPARYEGLLTVESNDPISSHLRIPVTLTVQPPCVAVHDADFRWEPPTPSAGETISFMGMAEGTAPIAFTWDWGEGDTEVGSLVTHTYRHAGNYSVVMTAMNCGTVTDTATHAVRVTEWHLYLPMILRRP